MGAAELFVSRKGGGQMLARQEVVPFQSGDDAELSVINVYPELRYQEMLGFGGAFTETSAYNYARLSPAGRAKVVQAYFDKKSGLGLNFCRTQIHSSDFSLSEFTYVEEGDESLATFSIDRDRKWILPFIQAARASADDLWLFASPWSPPSWMKLNKEFTHGGKLDPAFADCWARYLVRYVEEYQKEGVGFFGMSVQNEPMASQTWESCQYTAEEEGLFVRDHLKPALEKAGFGDVRILIWDHNKEHVYDRARDTFNVPGVRECVWGIGFHWYSGDHFNALSMAHEAFPDKPLVLSEFCVGVSRGETAPGPHSSWDGVELYTKELIGDFNNYAAASVDWNLMVDEDGGPFHNRDKGCKALIVVDPDRDAVTLEPLYYALAHFSKFVKRGAVRLGSTSFSLDLPVVAFENPDGTVVVVVLSCADHDTPVALRFSGQTARFDVLAKSLTTLVLSR